MPRCGNRGLCGCGRPECADAEAWWMFTHSWLSIAWAMCERSREQMTDDEIDYAREQDAHA